ncbi:MULTISPECIES: hypothetical protein [unclassified Arsenophonus]|uniref:hypothetical protein n=1 Tax=unclassified Arsenophonus TaxID=2627083 RepID=UPI00286069A0|nr:hypothetical protein [Arsenophonus sp.]MDR5611015.1 hypothetical protein [Arsenophonus sp.]MDR5614973.1 hypothetical protein [Arsenophonus sp.]
MIKLVKIFTISSFIIFNPITIEASVSVNIWINKETYKPCSVDIDYTKCYILENNQTILLKSANSDDNSIEQSWEETIQ